MSGRELSIDADPQGAAPRDARTAAACRRSSARRSATKAFTTCSTRCSTTCRRPPMSARSAAAIPSISAGAHRPSCASSVDERTQPLAALAFKVQFDDAGGQLTFVRVYTGILASATRCSTRPRATTSRSAGSCGCSRTIAKTFVRSKPGMIGAIIGLRSGSRPATRCAIRARRSCSTRSRCPNPVMGVVVEPETDDDHAKLLVALERLAIEDPSFRVKTDPDIGPDRDLRDGRAPPRDRRRSPAPRVRRQGARRQPAGRVSRDGHPPRRGREQVRRVAQLGGPRGEYGHVRLVVEPTDRGGGYVYENRAPASDIPQEHAPAVEAGVAEAVERGVLAGRPMTDLRVQVVGGSYHPVDSNNYAFKVAGVEGVRRGCQPGGSDAARAGHVARGRNSRRIRRRRPWRFACQTGKSRWNYSPRLVYKPSPVLSRWPRCSVTRPTFGREPEAEPLTRWNSITTLKSLSNFETT